MRSQIRQSSSVGYDNASSVHQTSIRAPTPIELGMRNINITSLKTKASQKQIQPESKFRKTRQKGKIGRKLNWSSLYHLQSSNPKTETLRVAKSRTVNRLEEKYVPNKAKKVQTVNRKEIFISPIPQSVSKSKAKNKLDYSKVKSRIDSRWKPTSYDGK